MKISRNLWRAILFTVTFGVTVSSAQSPVDLSSGQPSPAQGWVLLTDAVASHLSSGNRYQYLYVRDGRWYMSPESDLVWSWSYAQEQTGTYLYFDGTSVGSFECTGGELSPLGVGCSNGGGLTAKAYPTNPDNPELAQATLCQAIPDIFEVNQGCALTTVYVRNVNAVGALPVITVAVPAEGATYSQGAVVDAVYSCSADSGVDTCSGSVASGLPVDTAHVGPRHFEVVAFSSTGTMNVRIINFTVLPGQQQGWMLLTDEAASHLSAGIKQYLYLSTAPSYTDLANEFGVNDGNQSGWFMSPPTTWIWDWSHGQELPGYYSYFDGVGNGSIYCAGNEQLDFGIACTEGPGTLAYQNAPEGHGILCREESLDVFQVGRGSCAWVAFYVWQAPGTAQSPTPAGSNITVAPGAAALTFTSITNPGSTTVQQVDPATAGQLPGGFAVSNVAAYEVSTTATFSGPVTVGFLIPGPISETDFNNLRIFHSANGSLVDVTSGYNYAHQTIYGTTASFSPFYVARRGLRAVPLFDQTKAYKAGSTVPIKLQILNADTNVSAASLPVQVRGLLRLKDSTDVDVLDSGNSNPDYGFRFDPTIGGTGGYIFNLSTKGLSSGKYSLSFYVGNDKQYVYSVVFDVR